MRRGPIFITMVGFSLALAIIMTCNREASAEIYLWTDARGVVHMTDRWAKVPEPMRSRTSVRESSVPSTSAPQPSSQTEPQTITSEFLTSKRQALQMSPSVSESAQPSITLPSVPSCALQFSALVPWHQPSINSLKQFFPPFPFDVQLDPFDPNFVWVGPNRIPKDSLTYPHVSFDQQSQLRSRLRVLEEQRPSFRKPFPSQAPHR